MNARQFDSLRALVELYADNLPDELAERRMDQINKAGRNVCFAWAGGIKPGDPHYYRVQTPSFLIELDDTQDNANHIHSVWRDFSGDFGGDLLKAHYETSHGEPEGVASIWNFSAPAARSALLNSAWNTVFPSLVKTRRRCSAGRDCSFC